MVVLEGAFERKQNHPAFEKAGWFKKGARASVWVTL